MDCTGLYRSLQRRLFFASHLAVHGLVLRARRARFGGRSQEQRYDLEQVSHGSSRSKRQGEASLVRRDDPELLEADRVRVQVVREVEAVVERGVAQSISSFHFGMPRCRI